MVRWDVALRVLREPVRARSLRELAYVLVAVPLTLVSLLYVIVSLAVGTALAVTAIGIPLMSWVVPGTRWFGSLRRRLTNGLLGDRIPGPVPFQPPRGMLARVSAGLRDRVGWRSAGYLPLTLPLDIAGLFIVYVLWVWGLLAFTFPLQYALGQNMSEVRGPDGRPERALVFRHVVIDTWPKVLVVCLIGIGLLVLAPWALRSYLVVQRMLVTAMLGAGPDSAARIRDLERSRAYAIEDVATTLRRIERDLHDGVQARMVALAMNLTMLNETLGPDTTQENRKLLTAALDHARDGIAELRQMVSGIHPPALDAGLATALGTLAARSAIPVAVRGELPSRPTEAIETIAYFSVAELLTNVTKHSGADRAEIELSEADGRLVLRVSDDGRGGATVGGGTGLTGLTERVGTVDGRLAVDSPAGGPTVITIELPLHT